LTIKKSESRWPPLPIDDKLRARLAHGARVRAEMMRQIERGEQPQPGYRARWLQESAHAIIRLLGERGEVFNSTYEDDAVSMADFLDCIWSARSMLLNQGAAWSDALDRTAPQNSDASQDSAARVKAVAGRSSP
jgi:hypothetical protein